MSDRLGGSYEAVLCIALVVTLTIPHALVAFKQLLGSNKKNPDITVNYEDKDGIATEQSEKACSDRVQRIIVLLTAVVAVLAALFSVWDVTGPNVMMQQWLQLSAWIVILLQESVIISQTLHKDRYDLGIWSAASSLVLSITEALLSGGWHEPNRNGSDIALTTVKVTAGIILSITNVTFSHRPDVYSGSKLVDRQRTVSFLSRYTFSWPAPLLAKAAKSKKLEPDDIPAIGHEVRAKVLHQRWEACSRLSVWTKILQIYRSAWITQFAIQLLAAAAHFLPQALLFMTLRLLELRDVHEVNQGKLWAVTVGLGASIFVSSWLDSLLQWVACLQLELPIREQLAAVIYSKALRLKDVASVGSNHGSDGTSTAPSECGDDDGDDEPLRTKQSMINLLGVDAEAIATFARYSHALFNSAIEFVLAIAFLVNILDWKPVLWGCVTPIISVPLNYYISRGYSNAEETRMAASDRKMTALSELLQGIRQVKYSAQEKQWSRSVQNLRGDEIKKQEKVFQYYLATIALWCFTPLCMSVVVLASYFMINRTLSPSVAFTALSIFRSLETTLAMFPEVASDLMNSIVSTRRIKHYLETPEHVNCHQDGDAITFLQSTVAWPSDRTEGEGDEFKMHDINLNFPLGELSIISGRAGSGKSLLLLATIGEAHLVQGRITFPRKNTQIEYGASSNQWLSNTSTAFVSQNPWIENATVRDNILLGLPLDSERYRAVLQACCLAEDLSTMPNGDFTDLGANGVNLSGGQKWRVALARALYSRAEVLVLDDIFSAVDARVGRHLFENALTGELAKGRTRVVATHHVDLCWKEAKYYVLLDDGRVSFAGKPENFCPDLSSSDTSPIQQDVKHSGVSLQQRDRQHSDLVNPSSTWQDSTENGPGKPFYEAETRATGAVKLSVYRTYLDACGGYKYCVPIAITFIFTLFEDMAIPYWVSIWTRELGKTAPSTEMKDQSVWDYSLDKQTPSPSSGGRLWIYLGVYFALFFTSVLTEILRYHLVFVASIRASIVMFDKFLQRVLQAPLRFFDTTPVGQILNRFSADFHALDSDLGLDLPSMLHSVLVLLGVIIAALIISPVMIFFGVISLALSGYTAWLYVTAARDAKRIESNARSPVFEQFGSILDGLVTIRTFGKVDQYIHRMYNTIDAHCQALWHLRLFNCWMNFRLNMVGALYVAVTAALIATVKGIDASLAGFALSFALQMSEVVTWVLSEYAGLELDFNAVERIVEYTQLETEHQGGRDAPSGWPSKGKVEVRDLVVRYAQDLPPVLRGLSFTVNPDEHIGIVGRTGSGKSSLTLALLRFLEAQSGSIEIDGLNIASLKLHDLRSQMAIIPQDPVIFSGTLRSVLDPFHQHTDAELLSALSQVQLGTSTNDEQSPDMVDTNDDRKSTALSLSSPISERGKNLSQGQRQLVCLAQALLSRPKILIMDEATSSVDMGTDALIQRTIRHEFGDSTLMVIAHRLSTVADFDRILVMGEGEILEFDTPAALLQNEGGPFWTLVEKSGERENLRHIILGSEGL
ncbi:ATP-dependent bile acid permease [Aspergillus avenaceus]|uniref:ATP-dependent bile acid permease n=1 Tax=Aspergillus avenaceus TaxID=36643 RepID=A0A5N6TJX9_ASPAV|nr:ATP-dependent bile acid permease [Aspergillus avenaceus]